MDAERRTPSDVVIAGGGVIGLSLAWELAGDGARVTVLEKGRLGREASFVGAGIISVGAENVGCPPLTALLAASRRRLDEQSRILREETGIDDGLRWCGAVRVALGTDEADALASNAARWPAAGIEAREFDGPELRELEPALSPAVSLAYHVPGEGQIDNGRHLEALAAGCARRGVRLLEGTPVTGFERATGPAGGSRLLAVRTPGGPVPGNAFVAAAGPWTPDLVAPLGVELRGEPLRGQIVRLALPAHPVRHVVWRGDRYLVPRMASPLLVGSTMERAGFDRRPTVAGVRGLLAFAAETVPSLEGAELVGADAGLRPGSADGMPFLGRAGGLDNLYVSAGHSRSGIELSAGSARALADVVLGRVPDISLEPFDPNRFSRPAPSRPAVPQELS